jgi:hypothetical protein
VATESAWSKFRRWRRSRPFWGGLFLLLAALELFLSANLTLKNLQVHIGQEGYLSYLLPAILILCGLLSWVTPGQRLFYGILGLLTALYSFLGLNLGGFGLGMLIGIVGGALVVSWGPPRVKPAAARETDQEQESESGPEGEHEAAEPETAEFGTAEHETAEHETAGHETAEFEAAQPDDTSREHDSETTGILPGFPADGDPEPRPPSNGGVHRKLMVITLIPLALTAALLLAGSHTPARADPECPKGLPYRSATATTSPKESAAEHAAAKKPTVKRPAVEKPATGKTTPAAGSGASTTAPAPTAPAGDGSDSSIVGGIVDGIGKVLGIGGDESPSPTPSAEPSPTPDPTPSHSATPSPPGSATPSATGTPSGSATPTPTPTVSDVPCLGPRVFKDAKPDGEPSVSIKGGALVGKSLNMYDSTYDGTVDLQTANGPLKVLKFSMSRAVTEPFSLTITEPGGHHTVITTDQLTIKDNVKFYTPDFRGKLFGLFPVVFTPDSPPPLTLPWLYFSDVKINLSLVTCDTLTAKPLLDIVEVS